MSDRALLVNSVLAALAVFDRIINPRIHPCVFATAMMDPVLIIFEMMDVVKEANDVVAAFFAGRAFYVGGKHR
ncbi:MAG: hypothetical protein V1723_04315 [Candidatus Uhrbacteria bacterium]